MVGFGSSLRMARRSGWERAYLDYETLKMLLTQIEAVYEEEGAAAHHNSDTGGGRRRRRGRDYRDELFLEEDSDLAFLSSANDDSAATADADGTVGGSVMMEEGAAARDLTSTVPKAFSLTYSHEDPSEADAEDSDDGSMAADCASSLYGGWGGGGSGAGGSHQRAALDTTGAKATNRSSPNENRHSVVDEAEHGFFNGSTRRRNHQVQQQHGFLVEEQGDGGGGETFSLLTATMHPTTTATATEGPGHWYSFSTHNDASPPQHGFYGSTASVGWTRSGSATAATTAVGLMQPSLGLQPRSSLENFSRVANMIPNSSSGTAATAPSHHQGAGSNSSPHPAARKWQEEQARKRARQRARRRRRKRREREKKVPRHLRIAHAKARAITERFRGLLGAEVEKVTLFAQSRLGELADTAGSLRFPSYDENSDEMSFPTTAPHQPYHHHPGVGTSNNSHYEHPLSDGGGMHPSASSSSDEGTRSRQRRRRRRGIFPWSDSDSDEADAQSEASGAGIGHSNSGSRSPGYVTRLRKYSTGGLSAATDPFSNLTSSRTHNNKKRNRSGSVPSTTTTDWSPDHDYYYQRQQQQTVHDTTTAAIAAAQRQIAQFTKIRRSRPVFQRMDHILGEDLLLLSAVDEADGYTACAVELMHVLKYICVNVIAVRKICRKHDRLLMNRMLGGYYHRKRRQREQQQQLQQQSLVGRNKKMMMNNMKTRKASPDVVSQQREQRTLGAIVSQSLGDDYVDGSSITTRNNNKSVNDKLEGVFDVKIQELANSNTVQVISNCIALALSEYEVSHSRADALAKLNSTRAAGAANTGRSSFASGEWHQGRGGMTTPPSSDVEKELPCAPSTAPFGLSPSRWMTNSRVSATRSNKRTHDQEENDGSDRMPAPSELSDYDDAGPPSTASTVSLTRLRFTVVSIFAIRELARRKQDSFRTFVSRASLVYTGPNVVGEGLDGCSREILDFFVAYSPDAALLLDSNALYRGLREGTWRDCPIGSVMLSALAMSLAPSAPSSPTTSANLYIRNQDASLLNAVSIDPQAVDPRPWRRNQGDFDLEDEIMFCSHDEVDKDTLRLNRMSIFLYSLNYYLAHSTATAFVESTGAQPAHSASLIGAASFGALIAALCHCRAIASKSENGTWPRLPLDFYRTTFLWAAFFAFVGNVLHAIGVSYRSVALAVFGRVWIGFASVEILNRHILSHQLPPNKLVEESLLLVKWQLAGVVIGLLLGAFLALFVFDVSPFGQYVTTISSFHTGSVFMAGIWVVHWLRLYFRFRKSYDGSPISAGPEAFLHDEADTFDPDGSMSESSDEGTGTPTSILYRSDTKVEPTEATYAENLEAAYGTKKTTTDTEKPTPVVEQGGVAQELKRVASKQQETQPTARRKQWKSFLSKLSKALSYSVAIPVSIALVVVARTAQEILFTSCALITNRYFGWTGSQAGFLLGVISALSIPVTAVSGRISMSWDERTVMKHAIPVLLAGLLVMVNWASIANLAVHIRSLFKETSYRTYHPYDWLLGVYQYLVGFVVSHAGVVAIEGTTLSLLSKVAPTRANAVINCSTMLTTVSLAGRLLGDIHILMVGLSHRLINTDIVNSLVIPMLIATVLASYLVRRHFFFLM